MGTVEVEGTAATAAILDMAEERERERERGRRESFWQGERNTIV